jgi:hypothetical protein
MIPTSYGAIYTRKATARGYGRLQITRTRRIGGLGLDVSSLFSLFRSLIHHFGSFIYLRASSFRIYTPLLSVFFSLHNHRRNLLVLSPHAPLHHAVDTFPFPSSHLASLLFFIYVISSKWYTATETDLIIFSERVLDGSFLGLTGGGD